MTYAFRHDPGDIDLKQCLKFAGELNVPPVVAHLLLQRGFNTLDLARKFLFPQLTDLPSPFLMKGMNEAVSYIYRAVQEKWPVVIHGDYDVDGISATVLLLDFLHAMGLISVQHHLPNRLKQGYGLSCDYISTLAETVSAPALLITVDCGISAVKEVELAKKHGFFTIITDHHEPPDILPKADVILNPKQPECSFPFSGLSGVGVAFYFAMGIRAEFVRNGFWNKSTAPNLKQYLDLVALGTVADVMPLTETNRTLVRAGLEVITSRKRPGIWALCERAGLVEGFVTAEDISYRLAPRLNAAGRLGKPDLAARLLLSKKANEALDLAGELELINTQRRQHEEDALNDALLEGERQVKLACHALVIYGKGWHPGVIGIIASRVVDVYYKPAIVFTDDCTGENNLIKGSGRSIEGINLYESLKKCSDCIEQFGGHTMAVGLSVDKDQLEGFTDKFNGVIAEKSLSDKKKPILVDYSPKDNSIFEKSFFSSYRNLEPFGQGNPEPVFLKTKQQLQKPSLVKNHLKFILNENGQTVRGIGFGLGEQLNLTKKNIDLIFKIKNSTFRGVERIELHAVSIVPSL
ncbi:MAG: single-stranded-DNA-specific exonuclease RecJ [Desulfobulbaceae bacterium]|nr:single-stranded-DNA-specific exonuclease RecJ [Desulfobulbaceae bacterium]